MVDDDTRSMIRKAIRYNEIGDASPYAISFAGKGNSGGSFGAYQGDAHSDSARVGGVLRDVLDGAGVDADSIERIVTAVSGRCLENPLSDADTRVTNNALASDAGRAKVDAMDTGLEETVIAGVELCIAAAQARDVRVEPMACLYVACWTNMAGAPNQLAGWCGGTTVYRLGAAPPPAVTGEDVEHYLLRTDYFVKNPRNFLHLRECVQRAMA